ncbi:MAG: membrane protein insertion efficiency factor YidD [bacterium]|nr:membrane protein insertion efficiency factor YidD [bacterium]
MTDAGATVLAGFLRTYRVLISPLFHQALPLPGGCRFSPSCSAYGLAALRQYGLRIGFMFLWRRLSRCHPLSAGGFDPLP